MTINDPRDDPKWRVGTENYKGQFEKKGEVGASEVNELHKKSDVDSGAEALHHTLGTKRDQSSPGTHKHDGKDSVKIMTGMTITGAKAGNAALASVIAQLVKLGAIDNST